MGYMLSFSLKGGYEDAVAFIEALEIASHLGQGWEMPRCS